MSAWLNTEDAAKYLGISLSNLYSLAQQGRIPGNRVGKAWKFNREDLDTWVRANRPIEEFFATIEASIDDNPYLRDTQQEGYAAAHDFFASGKSKALLHLRVDYGKSALIASLPLGLAM